MLLGQPTTISNGNKQFHSPIDNEKDNKFNLDVIISFKTRTDQQFENERLLLENDDGLRDKFS